MIALVPKLAQFARDHPDVVLDVTTDNSRVDLVAAGFDAGIEIGEFIHKDTVAVPVSEDLRAAIVGSPKYFASHPRPRHPRDLLSHARINSRQGSRGLYRWEFDRGRQSLTVAVDGPLIVDDAEIQVRATCRAFGVDQDASIAEVETLARSPGVRGGMRAAQPTPTRRAPSGRRPVTSTCTRRRSSCHRSSCTCPSRSDHRD